MTGDPYWSNVSYLSHFDGANGSTTLHDSAFNYPLTTIGGAALTTTTSKFGTACLDTSGSSGGGAYNTNISRFAFGSGNFTVECWVYYTSATNHGIVISNYFALGPGWCLFANPSTSTNNVQFGYSTDGSTYNYINGSFSFSTSTWYSIATDFDGATCRVYVNGAIVGSGALVGAINTNTSGNFIIGNDAFLNATNFPGYIDEVRITKGTARYAGAYTPSTTPFPAYGTSPQPEAGTGFHASADSTNTVALTVTTWEPNAIIVIAAYNYNTHVSISGISGAGLTWNARGLLTSGNGQTETWWALAATPISAQTITLTYGSNFGTVYSGAMAVAGANPLTPWDGNVGLPATGTSSPVSITTTQANDCIITGLGCWLSPVTPTGFVNVVQGTDFSGSVASLDLSYQVVSSAQSGASISFGGNTAIAMIADALTSHAAPTSTGGVFFSNSIT